MKRAITVLVIVGVLGAAAAMNAYRAQRIATVKPSVSTAARPAAAMDVRKVRLTGEIVDPQCWFTHNGQGKGHAACAVRCAQGGQSLAFLDDQSGELYTVIAAGHGKNPNDGLYDHVGEPVIVHGTTYQRGNNRGVLLDSLSRP